ncbi:hypothetical protein [Nocardia miyunensis]|uniref:hypothetical protein n=1 Tax=Nocardia miyunensis TaxID=282684 RepID=UPI00082C5AE1|nr:hypothetical protein [Nocardia miyunensis]
MKIVTSTVRAVVVATLLGGSMLAGTGSAHAEFQCVMDFMPVRPFVGVGTVNGSAWASCDRPPEQHEMRLGLDFREGGQWQGVRLISDHRIPGTSRMAYGVKVDQCRPGYWRIEAEVVGTMQGHPFDYRKFSMAKSVTAEECARGGR